MNARQDLFFDKTLLDLLSNKKKKLLIHDSVDLLPISA